MIQPDLLEHLGDPGGPFSSRGASDSQLESDVLCDSSVPEDVGVLEDEPEPLSAQAVALSGRHRRGVTTCQLVAA